MNRYRVMVKWEMTENVWVDANNEEEAREKALDAFGTGDWTPGSEEVQDIENEGPVKPDEPQCQ